MGQVATLFSCVTCLALVVGLRGSKAHYAAVWRSRAWFSSFRSRAAATTRSRHPRATVFPVEGRVSAARRATGGKGGSSGTGTGGLGGEGGEDPTAGAPDVEITSPEHLGHPDDGTRARRRGRRGGLRGDAVARRTAPNPSRGNGHHRNARRGREPGRHGEARPSRRRYATSSRARVRPHGDAERRGLVHVHGKRHVTGHAARRSDNDLRLSSIMGRRSRSKTPAEGSVSRCRHRSFELFTVAPDPLVDDDAGAEIDEVTLTCARHRDTTSTRTAASTGQRRTSGRRLCFPTPPTDVAVENPGDQRPRSRGRYQDGMISGSSSTVGPTIDITAPVDEAVVGGEVRLEFTVRTRSPRWTSLTVSVTINDVDPVFDTMGRWTRNGGDFVYIFNSTIIDGDTGRKPRSTSRRRTRRAIVPHGKPCLLYLDNSRRSSTSTHRRFASNVIARRPIVLRWPSIRGPRRGERSRDRPRGSICFRAVVWDARRTMFRVRRVFSQAPTKQDSVFLYVSESGTDAYPSHGHERRWCLRRHQRPGLSAESRSAAHREHRTAFFRRAQRTSRRAVSFPIPSSCDYGMQTRASTEPAALITSDLARVISHAHRRRPARHLRARQHARAWSEPRAPVSTGSSKTIYLQLRRLDLCLARAEDAFSNSRAGNHGRLAAPPALLRRRRRHPANCPLPRRRASRQVARCPAASSKASSTTHSNDSPPLVIRRKSA